MAKSNAPVATFLANLEQKKFWKKSGFRNWWVDSRIWRGPDVSTCVLFSFLSPWASCRPTLDFPRTNAKETKTKTNEELSRIFFRLSLLFFANLHRLHNSAPTDLTWNGGKREVVFVKSLGLGKKCIYLFFPFFVAEFPQLHQNHCQEDTTKCKEGYMALD